MSTTIFTNVTQLESVLANEGAASIIPDMLDSESEDLHGAREPIEPVIKESPVKPSSRPSTSSSRRPRSAGKNLRINTPLSSPSPRPRTESTMTVVATTPTQASSRSVPLPPDLQIVDSAANERPHTPHLRRISSGASVSALKGASPTPPASATTQESMSSAGVPIQPPNHSHNVPVRPPSSMTTDNEEDDFQSAYSTSPRGEHFGANQLSGSDQDLERIRQNNMSRRVSKSEKRQTFGGHDTVHIDLTRVRSKASSVNTVDVVKTTAA